MEAEEEADDLDVDFDVDLFDVVVDFAVVLDFVDVLTCLQG